VFITPDGLALAEQLQEQVRHTLAPATGRLRPEQRAQLVELLEPVLTPPLTMNARPAVPRW
jgi:hypothetical protein